MTSKNRLLELILGASIIGTGCIAEVAAVTTNAILDSSFVPKEEHRLGLKIAGTLAGKNAQRKNDTRVKYEDANVDIYRTQGESNIRVAEEREMRKIDEEFYNKGADETSEAVNEVLGRTEGLNTRTVVNVVQREYKSHPFDWERNVEIITNAYKLDLSPNDKRRLQTMLEVMCGFGGRRNVYNIFSKDEHKKVQLYMKQNMRSIRENIDGQLILYEFVINHPDTKPKLRTQIIDLYPKVVGKELVPRFSNEDAIEVIRTKIDLLERVKEEISLSPKELNVLYLSRDGVGGLESLLQSKLKRIDPELKEKEKRFKDLVREYKSIQKDPEKAEEMLIQSEILDLAKEIGQLTYLRRVAGKIKLEPSVEEVVRESIRETPTKIEAPELELSSTVKRSETPTEPSTTSKLEVEEPEVTLEEAKPEEVPEESGSPWLISLLAALGISGGAGYKYRAPIYGAYKKIISKDPK